MDEIISMVQCFRQAEDTEQRVMLGEHIISHIAPDIRYFLFNAIQNPNKEDFEQEVLLAIATGLARFNGHTSREFWGWCYGIARNKLRDHFRDNATEMKYLQPTPPEELWLLLENATGDTSLSAQDRIDLDEAMKLLIAAKPDCYEILWQHFIFGLEYAEIAAERDISYDSARMKVGRCLDAAQSLIA